MKKISFFTIIFLLSFISIKAGVIFTNPVSTPSGTPVISLPNSNNTNSDVVTTTIGQYVYSIWMSSNKIQFSRSTTFGQIFEYPSATGFTSPDLSDPADSPLDPKMAASADGQYVFVLWKAWLGGANFILKYTYSNDWGDTWVSPMQITDSSTNPQVPSIATNNSGKNVYVVWSNASSSNQVQINISYDYGQTWTRPTSTPTGTPLNLSDTSSVFPIIVCGDSGEKVHVAWNRAFGGNKFVEIVSSNDSGSNWFSPSTTPGTMSPRISGDFATISPAKLTTNSDGSVIHCSWQTFSENAVQVAHSSDSGVNWTWPIQTPRGIIPTINPSTENAGFFHNIATDTFGQNVFLTWENSSTGGISVAYSDDFGNIWYYPTSVPYDNTSPNISNPARDNAHPLVATSMYGNVLFVSWIMDHAEGFTVAYSLDFGRSWQAEVLFPSITNTGGSPGGLSVSTTGNFAFATYIPSNGVFSPVEMHVIKISNWFDLTGMAIIKN